MITLATPTIGGLIDYAERLGISIGLTQDGKRLHLQGEKPPADLRITIAGHKEPLIQLIAIRTRCELGFLHNERKARAGELNPRHEEVWLDLLAQYQAISDTPISVTE